MTGFCQRITATWIAAALLLFSVAGVIFALIMQHGFGVVPCPLCITQRLELILVGVAAATALLSHRFVAGLRLGLGLAALFAVTGIMTAAWQVYIQATRPESVQCGPGIDYIFSNFPLGEALPMIFAADSECAIPSYLIEGWLTIPQASLAAFCIALALAVFGIYLTRTTTRQATV